MIFSSKEKERAHQIFGKLFFKMEYNAFYIKIIFIRTLRLKFLQFQEQTKNIFFFYKKETSTESLEKRTYLRPSFSWKKVDVTENSFI